MLTKDDLLEIQHVVRKEIESESSLTRSELQSEIKLARMEIETRLDKIDGRLKEIENKLGKAQKDISTIVSYFDREYTDIRKRVIVIEQQLSI